MANPDNLFTPGDRFQWFINECYGGVPIFVERFDFNASQVYRTINNISSPRLETLVLYALTGLNLHWMGTGKGNWWSPDEIGWEVAKKKGIVVGEGDTGSEAVAIDYASLVRTIFELVEESVTEKLAERSGTATDLFLHHLKKLNRNKSTGNR
jgi:hypothetical protein